MGLIDRILSLFVRERSEDERSGGRDGGAAATVEREAGTEQQDQNQEPAAAGTDAAASTGSLVDESTGIEPAEAAGPADDGETEPEPEPEPEPEGEPVETIKGIGPAYGERLADAGVETVPQLADADAGALAEATGISEKRIAGWIERARARAS